MSAARAEPSDANAIAVGAPNAPTPDRLLTARPSIEALAALTAVVVLNWNGGSDTVACLASLAGMSLRAGHTIVVDNASDDDSEERIRTAFPVVEWLQSGRNLGFAGGNNVGIRRALEWGAAYVWVLNNDTVVHPGALRGLLERVAGDPSIGLCGSTLVHHRPPYRVQAFGGAAYDRLLGRAHGIGAGADPADAPAIETVEARLDYVIGASMLATRAFLEGAGLLDEGYFLFYEELDWAARMPSGMRLGWAPGSVVAHKDGATIGKNHAHAERDNAVSFDKRLRYEYFLLRSKLRYTRHHDPGRLPAIVLGVAATTVSRLARGQVVRAWVLLRVLVAVATGWGIPALAREVMRGGEPTRARGRLRGGRP